MLDLLIYGILQGATFALVAFGFSLVLGVLGVVNMVHGVFVVVGGLVAYHLSTRAGWFIPAAIAAGSLAGGALAAVVQLLVRRVHDANPLMVLVQTFGLSIVITSILEKTSGAGELLLRADVPGYPIVEFGDVIVPTTEILIFLVALASTAILFSILELTEFGRSVRACRDNPRHASLLGVRVQAVYFKTMVACGLWTGLAGALLVTTRPLAPYMHLHWTLDAFLIVVIGGLGSVPGVLLGGFLFGIANYLSYYYAPAMAPAIIFASLVVLLLMRPQGLFGLGAVARK